MGYIIYEIWLFADVCNLSGIAYKFSGMVLMA